MKESSRKTEKRVRDLIRFLRSKTQGMEAPAATKIIKKYGTDPYLTLIACLLSLRTRDTVSYPASVRLFQRARTPKSMLKLSPKTIEKLIYPVGFYPTKTRWICAVSKELLERFKGKVPKTQEELLSLPGVGLKTANLVLSEAFGIPAICVDTHVHRIANQIGMVKTKSPEQTERKLREIVPKRYWRELNPLFVIWGQNKGPIAPLRSIWQEKKP